MLNTILVYYTSLTLTEIDNMDDDTFYNTHAHLAVLRQMEAKSTKKGK